MTPLETAELQFLVGPVYNLITLYYEHQGTVPRLETHGAVRTAIANLVVQDHVRNKYFGVVGTTSNARFIDRDFRCLLITLQPRQYMESMLPYQLVSDLRHYVDNQTNLRFRYATARVLNASLYWNILESDTIMDIATEAFSTPIERSLTPWWQSFLGYITSQDISDPVMIVRDTLCQQHPNWAPMIPATIATEMTSQRTTRTTGYSNISSGRGLCCQLTSRTACHQRHATSYSSDTLSTHFSTAKALHLRDATSMRRQEFLF